MLSICLELLIVGVKYALKMNIKHCPGLERVSEMETL